MKKKYICIGPSSFINPTEAKYYCWHQFQKEEKVQYWDLFIQFVSNILLNVVIVVPPLLTHHHNCHARVCMNDSSLKPSSSSSKALATSRPVHWAASPDNYSPTSGASFSRSDLDPAELGQGLPTTG